MKNQVCEPEASTWIFRGMATYAEYLSNIAINNMGAFGTAFGANPSSIIVHEDFYKYYSRVSASQVNCSVYELELDTSSSSSMPEPTLSFV